MLSEKEKEKRKTEYMIMEISAKEGVSIDDAQLWYKELLSTSWEIGFDITKKLYDEYCKIRKETDKEKAEKVFLKDLSSVK